MLADRYAHMFQQLAGVPALREWLAEEQRETQRVLTHMADIDQLRMAQGRAQLLDRIVGHLDFAAGSRGTTRR